MKWRPKLQFHGEGLFLKYELVLSADRTGNNHTLGLVGAFVDLGNLCIAHHALYRILSAVAVAAEDLNRVRRHRHRRIRSEFLRHRRFFAVGQMLRPYGTLHAW